MVIKIFIKYFVVLILLFSITFSQIKDDMNFIIRNNLKFFNEENVSNDYSLYDPSEIKLLFLSMIRFYQNWISSQHPSNKICVFIPSCSQFGLYSIKKYGVFYGVLMTSDRIQRCHGFSGKFYSIDPIAGKYHDPIESYYFELWKMPF